MVKERDYQNHTIFYGEEMVGCAKQMAKLKKIKAKGDQHGAQQHRTHND
jgi:hypothetical protein